VKPDGITDRPVPPWELPGAFRRDAEPHRADWLSGLANAAYGACSLAFVISTPIVLVAVVGGREEAEVGAAVLAISALPGLLLGAVALAQARRDLGLMLRGLMDPGGQDRTAIAAQRGRDAVVLSLILRGAAAYVLLLLALSRG
jgi:hypothetical protein